MQQLRDTASQLMILNDEIAQTYSRYQNDRKLFCRSGCGECCLHPGIEASVLEMLPLALHLYDQGIAESTLEALQQHNQAGCFFIRLHQRIGKVATVVCTPTALPYAGCLVLPVTVAAKVKSCCLFAK